MMRYFFALICCHILCQNIINDKSEQLDVARSQQMPRLHSMNLDDDALDR
jgi:hypothetical protein